MGARGDEIGESQIRHLPSRFRAPHMHADAATCVWEAETRDYGAGEREREVGLLRGRTSEEEKERNRPFSVTKGTTRRKIRLRLRVRGCRHLRRIVLLRAEF